MVVRLFDQIIDFFKRLKYLYLEWRLRSQIKANAKIRKEVGQDLKVYWNEDFSRELRTWGLDTAWLEIQYLLIHGRGKVLDIACGCGSVMTLFNSYPHLKMYGCDISDFLIGKAVESVIPGDQLKVCDATKTHYQDNEFDYSYSIGSLEHFTEEGILAFIREAYRITSRVSFHQIPTARSEKNEGWIRLGQSYFNNSVEWWLEKFKSVYDNVTVLSSRWEDPLSLGKWFVCAKN